MVWTHLAQPAAGRGATAPFTKKLISDYRSGKCR